MKKNKKKKVKKNVRLFEWSHHHRSNIYYLCDDSGNSITTTAERMGNATELRVNSTLQKLVWVAIAFSVSCFTSENNIITLSFAIVLLFGIALNKRI